jgi:hypothetical protein
LAVASRIVAEPGFRMNGQCKAERIICTRIGTGSAGLLP